MVRLGIASATTAMGHASTRSKPSSTSGGSPAHDARMALSPCTASRVTPDQREAETEMVNTHPDEELSQYAY